MYSFLRHEENSIKFFSNMYLWVFPIFPLPIMKDNDENTEKNCSIALSSGEPCDVFAIMPNLLVKKH